MGLFSNKVNRSQLQPGDHIYTYRRFHTYSHHGIYVEADRVIHYTITNVTTKNVWIPGRPCKICRFHPKLAAGGVVKTCVNCFLQRDKLYRFEYGVTLARFVLKNPGTCTTGSSHSADVVIHRAADTLNKKMGFGDYDLIENNCESFAIFCKTSIPMSEQACSALGYCKMAFKSFVKNNVDRLLQDVLVHHPDKHMQLKQAIEILLTLPCKEIIVNLKKLNVKYADDQEEINDEYQLDDDELVETREEEEDDDRPSQSSYMINE